MGIEALTHNDEGIQVIPETSADWDEWVSAGRTRNWLMKDPLIDWLQRYGESRGYKPKQDIPEYDNRLDFVQFIFRKGHEFEEGILNLLKEQYEIVQVAQSYEDILVLEKAEETFEAMRQGASIIYQAVLRDAQHMTYGSPDFLIRSDVLHKLFPNSVSKREASLGALDLQSRYWHYIVVDTKFTTIHLNASGSEVANDGSAPAYKAQMYIYNRALGRLQGHLPEKSYLLGRGWQQRDGRNARRCANALDRLGPIRHDGTIANRVPIAYAVEQAVAWVRRVRADGKDWRLFPTPSVPELYPNMSNVDDGDMMMWGYPDAGDDQAESPEQWVGVKQRLADELKELTSLWFVGAKNRDAAHERGIHRWDDPRLTPADVGIKGTRAVRLERLLEVNTDGKHPPVRPTRISNTRESWHTPAGVEFYVDFEFCSDLNDDFCNLPEKGGQPLIFMIGCGHMESGEWRFKSLVVDDLTEEEELRIIREWAAHMSAIRDRLDPGGKPRVFHWSQAEVIALETAYNSARVRHGSRADWPSDLGWHDFLKSMREEPIVTRGALNFGLKTVAKEMRSLGLIQTDWGDSQVDGLGAMVGAWRCQEDAKREGVSMAGLDLMQKIKEYNEIDCKAMMDIIRYLRDNH